MTDREFFERYNRDVYRTCYYMLRNASDAEDVCQEVFMKALTSGWEQVEFLKTWLMRITVNHCLNHLRRSKSRWMKEKMLLLFQREQVEPSVLTVVEQKESEDEWKRRLAKLPDKIPHRHHPEVYERSAACRHRGDSGYSGGNREISVEPGIEDDEGHIGRTGRRLEAAG